MFKQKPAENCFPINKDMHIQVFPKELIVHLHELRLTK